MEWARAHVLKGQNITKKRVKMLKQYKTPRLEYDFQVDIFCFFHVFLSKHKIFLAYFFSVCTYEAVFQNNFANISTSLEKFWRFD